VASTLQFENQLVCLSNTNTSTTCKPGADAGVSAYGSDALVILPEHHPITIKKIDSDALHVLRKINRAGFKGYLVGGGVRDLYLGKKPKDFDISTNAKPGQLRKLFPNSSTIGRRFRLVQVFFKGGKIVEVSTLRSLSEHDLDGPEQVLAPNNTFGTLSEDAQRRDLTINALFYDIKKSVIIDYVQGVEDLEASIVRMVGPPVKRITRDPVRMMRAIRHCARNDFIIERNTWKAICSNSDKLAFCPPSRLRDETLKDLYSGAAASWFKLALKSGIFVSLFSPYRSILSTETKESDNLQKQLLQIFNTIDRTNNIAVKHNIHCQPDFFFLALILIPWAESQYQIFSTRRKGSQLFQISKQLRAELDQTLGINLNLRRSLRQEIVNLLTNLSSLLHNRKDNSWPNWLRKKSYFKKCSLFYNFYIEAKGGRIVTDQLLHQESAKHSSSSRPSSKNKQPSGRNKPAFTSTKKGGVFGFKK